MFNQSALEQKLKIYFKDAETCRLAFIHKSFINEVSSKEIESNERLEFLGDAVLELVVTSYLYAKFPKMSEGELTPIRSALVRGTNLAKVAQKLELGNYLFLSKGEEASGGRQKEYILANVVEALIGAIYLDLGYEKAERFIQDYILINVEDIINQKAHLDTKSYFQEKSQELKSVTPEYRLVSEHGPDHNKEFTMGLYLDDQLIATGKGSSKQKAEQNAAENGIKELNW
jgi:ribonuclease-3